MEGRIVVYTDTLGDLLKEGNGLYPWCDKCGRSAPDLDIVALAAARGEAYRWRRLRMRCAQCGGLSRPILKWNVGPGIDVSMATANRRQKQKGPAPKDRP